MKFPSYSYATITLFTLYAFSILIIVCDGKIKLPKNISIPALIAFGDSIVDQGNNNNLLTAIKCDFPPYGKDFLGGLPTGRFSNGKTPADLLAEELGIKEYVPAYLDPLLNPTDLLTGVSFASGSTGYDPQTSYLTNKNVGGNSWIYVYNDVKAKATPTMFPFKFGISRGIIKSVLSLSDELNMFREYIGKLKALIGEERTNFIIKNSMYLVIAGSNDLANTYFTIGLRRLRYDINSYTDFLVQKATEFLKELYKLGAKRLALFCVPPRCLPAQKTLTGDLERECNEDYNRAAQMYNSKLITSLKALNYSFNDPKARIIYIDIYNPLFDLIQNHEKYAARPEVERVQNFQTKRNRFHICIGLIIKIHFLPWRLLVIQNCSISVFNTACINISQSLTFKTMLHFQNRILTQTTRPSIL